MHGAGSGPLGRTGESFHSGGNPARKGFHSPGEGNAPARGARGTGDLHVHVVVDVPKKLTDRQRALLEELAREMRVEVEDSGVFRQVFPQPLDSRQPVPGDIRPASLSKPLLIWYTFSV